MKTLKLIAFAASIIIEVLAIVLFILREINTLSFVLIVIPQFYITGIYFLDRYKQKQHV